MTRAAALAAMLLASPALADEPLVIDLDSPGWEGIPYGHAVDARERAELCKTNETTGLPTTWAAWDVCSIPTNWHVGGPGERRMILPPWLAAAVAPEPVRIFTLGEVMPRGRLADIVP